MDTATIVGFLQECAYMIAVFGFFVFFAFHQGRQTVTNIILGLYMALLISIEFPFYDLILGGTGDPRTESILRLLVFAAFTFAATMLFQRLLPREYDESTFEGFGRKILLALAGTVLVMVYSYHVLPITELITPGSPIDTLFGSEQNFFWWLMAPMLVLFMV